MACRDARGDTLGRLWVELWRGRCVLGDVYYHDESMMLGLKASDQHGRDSRLEARIEGGRARCGHSCGMVVQPDGGGSKTGGGGRMGEVDVTTTRAWLWVGMRVEGSEPMMNRSERMDGNGW